MTTYVNTTVIKPTTANLKNDYSEKAILASMTRNYTFVFNISQNQPQLKSQNISEILMIVLRKPYSSKKEEK